MTDTAILVNEWRIENGLVVIHEREDTKKLATYNWPQIITIPLNNEHVKVLVDLRIFIRAQQVACRNVKVKDDVVYTFSRDYTYPWSVGCRMKVKQICS